MYKIITIWRTVTKDHIVRYVQLREFFSLFRNISLSSFATVKLHEKALHLPKIFSKLYLLITTYLLQLIYYNLLITTSYSTYLLQLLQITNSSILWYVILTYSFHRTINYIAEYVRMDIIIIFISQKYVRKRNYSINLFILQIMCVCVCVCVCVCDNYNYFIIIKVSKLSFPFS